MEVMKKILKTAVATASLILTAFPVLAMPVGRSNEGIDYLFKDPVLSRFTAGVYGGEVNREIKFKHSSFETEMKSTRGTAYLGFSLLKWLSVYAVAGQNTAEISGMGEADGEAIYGGGMSINLLNHFLREPVPMEDAFRLNLGLQTLTTEADFVFDTFKWREISGALTLSIINHTTGNKEYTPESIALYVGPAFSYVSSDDFETKNTVGVVGGLEIFFTDSFAIDFRVEYFEKTSGSIGLNLHF
jgi:opacity protein-like surface antigen